MVKSVSPTGMAPGPGGPGITPSTTRPTPAPMRPAWLRGTGSRNRPIFSAIRAGRSGVSVILCLHSNHVFAKNTPEGRYSVALLCKALQQRRRPNREGRHRAQDSTSTETTNCAKASEAVRPGLSIPKRLMRPETPCSAGPERTKSRGGSPGFWSFGRMPE